MEIGTAFPHAVAPKETLALKGCYELIAFDPEGRVKAYRRVDNLVVSVGKAQVAGLINSALSASSGGAFRYLALGSSSSATAAGDTTLGAELNSSTTYGGLGRAIATTLDRVTTTVTNDTARLIKTFTLSSGSCSINEAAVFDASSGGEMLSRQPFAIISLSSGDSLQTTWQVQVS